MALRGLNCASSRGATLAPDHPNQTKANDRQRKPANSERVRRLVEHHCHHAAHPLRPQRIERALNQEGDAKADNQVGEV